MDQDQKSQAIFGRPPIPIDFEQLDKMIQIHCTLEEIAFMFKCSIQTIERRVREEKGVPFGEYYKHLSTGGKVSLRRKVWDLAVNKENVSMLALLSKQPEERGGLGFAEKIVNENYDGKGEYEKMMGIVQRLEDRKKSELEEDDGN
jgi:hypothetical protein